VRGSVREPEGSESEEMSFTFLVSERTVLFLFNVPTVLNKVERREET
jgi:hypothetical protein